MDFDLSLPSHSVFVNNEIGRKSDNSKITSPDIRNNVRCIYI